MANNFKANPKPVDHEVQIPEAVRRAAAAADAAIRANNPQPQPTPQDNPGEFIQIAEPPPPQRLPNSVTTASEAPPPAPQEPQPQPQPQPASIESPPNYEHMYKAMKGRFDQSTNALNGANQRIEALEHMLAAMQAAPAPSPAPTPAPRQLITQKDIDEVGPDMLDIIRRAAQEVVPQVDTSSLQAELAKLRQEFSGTAQVVTQSAKDAMHAKMDREIAGWQSTNHDPDFHAWLALPDAYSGVTRSKLLTEAYAQNQADRVISFFKGFASELAATRPPEPQPQSQPAGHNPTPPTGPTLRDLAAPGRARVAAAPTPPAEKQTIYTSDVNAFYTAVRKGHYKGREELQAQHEAELTAAMREGRVVKNT